LKVGIGEDAIYRVQVLGRVTQVRVSKQHMNLTVAKAAKVFRILTVFASGFQMMGL
jgi:hypothetical protein